MGPRLQREGLCKFSSCQPSSLCCLCLTIALLQPREEHGQQSVRQSVSEALDSRAKRLCKDSREQGNNPAIRQHQFGVWTGRLRGRFPQREEEGGQQRAALLFGQQACCCWTKASHSQVGGSCALTSEEGPGELTLQGGRLVHRWGKDAVFEARVPR